MLIKVTKYSHSKKLVVTGLLHCSHMPQHEQAFVIWFVTWFIYGLSIYDLTQMCH